MRMEDCNNCPHYSTTGLKKLGVEIGDADFVIALAGNPNTGKSTVFNSLTGLRQHTGNWPGKTVTRMEGAYNYDNAKYKIVDLPGTYSLLSTSDDETVARNFILFGKPNVTILVADASRLERNLNLIIQVLEITNRAVLCLNLMDEARRLHIEIDDRELARELGIPVVPCVARSQEGIPQLLKTVHDVATDKIKLRNRTVRNLDPRIEKSLDIMTTEVKKEFPEIDNPRWIALRLLEGDASIIDSLRKGELVES